MDWCYKTVLLILSYLCVSNAIPYTYINTTFLQSKVSAEIQAESARAVIRRILQSNITVDNSGGVERTVVASNLSEYFLIDVDPNLFVDGKDQFSVVKLNNTINIKASSGVAATWGFNYYLKEYCNAHVGWQIKQVNIDYLPFVNVTVIANDKFRYYQNVCTASYSFVWWTRTEWRQHLDWMALNGINLSLAPHGQEAIWKKIYKSLNLTDDEIDEHFSGPAFLSWQRMGNVRGWAGPLTENWHNHTLDLEEFIVEQMLNLGIIPILPAFGGYVPKAMKRIYPEATFRTVSPWNHFDSYDCCPLFIDPEDNLFKTIGTMFLSEIVGRFGKHNVYYSDPYNEMIPSSLDPKYLKKSGEAIFSAMTDVDPDAVWLLQNWMFVHDPLIWTRDRARALITSVPFGRLLILDLQSEQWPQYEVFDDYFGQPYIWCMLHNFGGTLGMFGNTDVINSEVYRARNKTNSTMVGIGLTMEGINQNYVVYDLMLESAWRKEPIKNMDEWVERYAQRRYGFNSTHAARAWRYLFKSVYNFRGLNRMRGKYVITRRPSLNIKPWAWYHSHDLIEAWKSLLLAVGDQPKNLNKRDGLGHDLCDLTRQVLQYRAEQVYLEIIKAYKDGNTWTMKEYISVFLDILSDLREILSTNRHFSAMNWIQSSINIAKSNEEAMQYEFNARNQITLWGPNGEISDYACKQWAELFRDYYTPRWRLFFDALSLSLGNQTKFDERAVRNVIAVDLEKTFRLSMGRAMQYISEADNTAKVARRVYARWVVMPGVNDLPITIITTRKAGRSNRSPSTSVVPTVSTLVPTVIMMSTLTPSD